MNIEKGIPIPPKTSGMKRKAGGPTETLESMEVGDSVLANDSKARTIMGVANKLGIKITTRKQDDGSFRIWRIA